MISLSAPVHTIKASVVLSGSKSISNRLLILKEVLKKNVLLENLSGAEDTVLLQRALEQIRNKTSGIIDIHHAGTDMRFLTALLSVTPGQWQITGSERMKQRPIGDLVTALRELGADISYLEKRGFPPLSINGQTLNGGPVNISGAVSSQFISALLLISPLLQNGLVLNLTGKAVSRPYIEMTVALLKESGADIRMSGGQVLVNPSSIFHLPSSLLIESDWSSASYWYSICALSKGSEIELKFLYHKSLQADSVLPELYARLGVSSLFKDQSVVISSSKEITADTFSYDFTDCPDIAQTVAATCLGLGVRAELTGLQTLKVKETDRIAALKQELEKLGAVVEATDHSITMIPPASVVSSQPVETYHDHRMAMSFAPLALVCPPLLISDPGVVAKSYPGFWQDLKSVGFNVHLQP